MYIYIFMYMYTNTHTHTHTHTQKTHTLLAFFYSVNPQDFGVLHINRWRYERRQRSCFWLLVDGALGFKWAHRPVINTLQMFV